MKTIKIIYFLLLCTTFISCGPSENTYQKFDLTDLSSKCKTQKKYLITILTIDGCNFCDRLHQIIKSSSEINNVIQKNFILSEVNINTQQIIAQILYTTSVPAILILDSALSVKYVHSGLISEFQLLNVLKKVANNNTVICSPQTDLYSSGNTLYRLYSYIFQAYSVSNKLFCSEEDNKKAIELLKKSIQIEPYFMNQYLLMNAYYRNNMQKEAEQIKQSLNAEIIFNHSLYENIFDRKIKIDTANISFSQKSNLYIENNTFDLGNIQKGNSAELNIKFNNKGEAPLIITKVDASCGCIKSEWTRKPIHKNEEGNILLKYFSDSPGYISKRIVIYSNAQNNPTTIIVKGTIK